MSTFRGELHLPVVPACGGCNSRLSLDEEYVACLVECAIAGTTEASSVQREKVRRILERKPTLVARLERARTVTPGGCTFSVERERVRNVVLKLARGHAAFELNEPQLRQPSSIAFAPLPAMSEEVRDRFETPPRVTAWPEVGSRGMQQMAISVATRQVSAYWIEVQENRYRYLATVSDGVVVRMVLSEYLACEVTWA